MPELDHQLSARNGKWVLLATILASSVVFIDMTIVNLALPVMQLDLDASFSVMQWVVEAYVLLLTSLMLVGGSLADAYGRRRLLCLGAGVFALASAGAGFAADGPQLIAARILQGIGGAMLAPASLALVSSSFPTATRGKALGLWAAFSGISTAIAPPLGGLLIEAWSWRAVFFVNLPLLAIVIFVAYRYIPESRIENHHKRVDVAGAVTAVIALGALTFTFLRAGEHGFTDLLVALCGAIAALAGAAFVVIERRVENPMLPLGIFASRAFAGLNLMTLILFIAVSGMMFFLPMVLMQSFGYSPTQAGAAVIPSMLAMFIISPLMGRYIDRAGARLPILIGPWISALAYVLFALNDEAGYWTGLWLPIVVMGIGFGAWVTPLTSAVMSVAGEQRSGLASGINNAVARLAQLLAIALLGLLAAHTFQEQLDLSLMAHNSGPEWLELLAPDRVKLGGMRAPASLSLAAQSDLNQLIQAAFRDAFARVAWVAAGLCIGASAIGYWATSKPCAHART